MAPMLQVTPLEFRKDLWNQKTKVPVLFPSLFSHWYNTGLWQTDRQTERHKTTALYRASIASRGKNVFRKEKSIMRCKGNKGTMRHSDCHCALYEQEIQLTQRDRATHYVSWNLVNCCTAVRKITFERLAVGEWPWKSLKVIGITAIR